MLNTKDIMETINMIQEENLDIRTITMGISLLDCIDPDPDAACRKIYDKIMKKAGKLVQVGEEIEKEYGVPIINKRISVTPIAIISAASGQPIKYAHVLEKAAMDCGVNFIGGYSALVQKGFAPGDEELIRSIPRALAETDHVCSSVNIGSTKAGINLDACKLMGQVVRDTAEATKDRNCIGAAKLVVFCNAPEDNPFMAGAFHGVGEADCIINVGVSGPGVVRAALAKAKDASIAEVADIIKKTAFKITRMGQLVGTVAGKRLGVPFGIVDLSLAPTPAVGDSVAHILEEIGLEQCGTHGTTAALAMLNDAVKKGWRDGLQPGRRPFRRFYSGDRRRWHDRRRSERFPAAGKAGSYDRGVQRGIGYDCDSWRHSGYHHFRYHCRRSCHWYGELQDHRGACDPCHWSKGRGRTGLRRTAGIRPGDGSQSQVRSRLHQSGRPDPRAHAELEELTGSFSGCRGEAPAKATKPFIRVRGRALLQLCRWMPEPESARSNGRRPGNGSSWEYLKHNCNYALCVSHRGFVVGRGKDGFRIDPAGCWRNSAGDIPLSASTD